MPPPRPRSPGSSGAPASSAAGGLSEIGAAVAASPAVRDEINREKQEYLFELNKMAAEGHVRLTRHYTMADSLADISYEYQRQKEMLRTRRHVVMIRNGLEVSLNLAAGANKRFGPVLDLDGWEQQLHHDMHVEKQYDDVLERLYKKHWRRGSTSPEMELAWLVGSSAVGYHIKRKCGFAPRCPGVRRGSAAAAPRRVRRRRGMGNLFGSVMRGMMGGGGVGGAFGSPPPASPPTTGAPRRSPTFADRGPVMPPPQQRAPAFSVPPAQPPPPPTTTSPAPPAPTTMTTDVSRREMIARAAERRFHHHDEGPEIDILFPGDGVDVVAEHK